ncbi:MAG: 50S ribosomal protein L15 [Candidatus Jacksonbacteria bacterium]|jgi:large subunit ribosomal protein L15|nr:50S ribosomal protein L15 [Candidatus Jacksonbacteria bacterium]MBT6034087.1 50S ribosomal protein L15 [Candidatus Jacksonbacteria bacterium]MBT6301122.1 50S ribosomal protein L15 [Candidatus Jacksonbacteria bacterium]MBT6757295.1 50S ribosomal protein L15 [Candidatus Jacksonbacteria bacterium]MBT6955624.1 50S ribosomal protein L15 [Candidatus Jacksonbacteria bacterium]
MALSLHTIQPNKGSRKKSKRVGRGNASGAGTFSGRGMKGQRSRTGGKGGLRKRAITQQFLSKIPKLKGFNSLNTPYDVVNLDDIDAAFKEADTVTKGLLIKKGLVNKNTIGVKCLGRGTIAKPLTIKLDAVSESAKEKIEKAGGSVVIVKKERVQTRLPKEARLKARAKEQN